MKNTDKKQVASIMTGIVCYGVNIGENCHILATMSSDELNLKIKFVVLMTRVRAYSIITSSKTDWQCQSGQVLGESKWTEM